MKAKSFQQYLEKRLDKAEIAELEKSAKLEFEIMKSFQKDISNAVENYMADENIGFNELVRRLNISPTQASRIRSGGANLTLSTVAHILRYSKCELISFLTIKQKKEEGKQLKFVKASELYLMQINLDNPKIELNDSRQPT